MARQTLGLFAALAVAGCNQPATPSSDAEARPRAAIPAPASEAFVGHWAVELSQCVLEQDDPDSPILMTAKGYDQHEAHCDFASVSPAGANEWNVAARCTTALTAERAFKFKVDGDTLTILSDAGANTYVRCPAS